jgi:hypothetical protein
VRGKQRWFDRAGVAAHLEAHGPAVRTDPAIPRSTRNVAGAITIPR